MKKISLVLMAVLGISLAATPRAQAGILIGAINGNVFQGMTVGALIGGSIGGALAITGEIVEGSEGLFIIILPVFIGGGAIAGVFLDVDAALPSDELAEGFKDAFPFIDNSEALTELALVTKAKIQTAVEAAPEAEQLMVQLNREEVTQALSAVDLSSKQLELVIEALK
jgi:hypothetical protein